MARKPILAVGSLVTLSALFAVAMLHLLVGRFSRGNDFAPYSTFRADPLGMKVLYDALRLQTNPNTTRFLDRIGNLPEGTAKTLFICGASMTPDRKQDIQALERFAAAGGRVVIAFAPEQYSEERWKTEQEQNAKKKQTEEKNNEDAGKPKNAGEEAAQENDHQHDRIPPERASDLAPWSDDTVSIDRLWNFKYAHVPSPERTPGEELKPFSAMAERELTDGGAQTAEAPASLTWRSTLYFEDTDRAWKSVYQWRPSPSDAPRVVVMERSFGEGSVVLCSDSYLMSNEAMQKDRSAAFLSWLIGSSKEVIFDESHLGTQYSAGVMALVWKYRLHGVVLTILILACLFIWISTTSLLPKRSDEASEKPSSAKDNAAALANLLRYSIPRASLLDVCVSEWRKSKSFRFRETGADGVDQQKLERVMAVVRSQREKPKPDCAAGYAEIREILSERKYHREH